MTKRFKFLARYFVWLALDITITGQIACAQTSWISGNGGWNDGLNWSAGVPDITSAVLITNAGSKIVTIDLNTPAVNRAARRIDLTAPTGATNTLRLVSLGIDPFRLANSFTLNTGSRLEVSDSFLVLDGSEGGSLNQFAGKIILSGGGIATTNSDPLAINGQPVLRIGRAGVGSATVLAGELKAFDQLVVADLSGSLGTLTLSNGIVTAGGIVYVADDPGSIGRVDVFGGSFIATNDTSRIGDDGDGTLSQFGGLVVLDGASVGRGSNAVGRVNVRGGLMRPGSLSLGRFATAQGTLEVSGGSLDMSTSTLYVGREGAGTAIFSNGIALAQTVIIAASNTASGALQLRGGSLTAGQLLATRPSAQLQFDSGTLVVTQSTTVANGAAFVVGNGSQIATLQLDGGNHSFANGLTLSSNAVLKGSGTVTGTITVLPGGSNQLGVPAGLTLAPNFIGGKFTFSFPSATGKFYDVFARTNLATTNWTLQTTLSGTGAVLTYTNNPTNPARLFRVQIR